MNRRYPALCESALNAHAASSPHTLENKFHGRRKSSASDCAGGAASRTRCPFLSSLRIRSFRAGRSTVLQISAEQQCMLVSHDVRTLPRYFREFIDRRDSPGLVLIPQRLALRTAIESLVLLWAVCEDTEWLNRICYLPIRESNRSNVSLLSL